MKIFFYILLFCFTVLVSSCAASKQKTYVTIYPLTKSLGYASEQILIDGHTCSQVKHIFGSPNEVWYENFFKVTYGLPDKIPVFDEQWVYIYAGKLEHVLIFFKDEKVVLAVREWSDY